MKTSEATEHFGRRRAWSGALELRYRTKPIGQMGAKDNCKYPAVHINASQFLSPQSTSWRLD